MNQDQLTPNEIETLIDALKAWKSAPAQSEMIGAMVGAILHDPKDGKAYDAALDTERIKNAGKDRGEQAIVLQAKLIHMKHNALVNAEFNPDLTRAGS